MRRRTDVPLPVTAIAVAGVAMIVPGIIANETGEHAIAQNFYIGGVISVVLAGFLGVATANSRLNQTFSGQIIGLFTIFLAAPLVLAVPVYFSLDSYKFLDTYFEMVSCLTTTGASIFPVSAEVSDIIHFWRGFVAWMGGLLVLVSAIVVMEPLQIGGFETTIPSGIYVGGRRHGDATLASDKVLKHLALALPFYCGLTAVLWGALVWFGKSPLAGAVIAMSTVSTSGITLDPVLSGQGGSIFSEAIVLVFLLFALSRQFVASDQRWIRGRALVTDGELRLAGVIFVLALLAAIILRWPEWADMVEAGGYAVVLRELWGFCFTVISFLTTAGFESAYWTEEMRENWGGFPALLLLCLAFVGGGVGTTAGGIKLLRMVAIYRHAINEISRAVYPSALEGLGTASGRMRREGLEAACVFFVLYVIFLACLHAVLATCGLDFTSSLTLATAALTTTGPLANMILGTGFSYGDLNGIAKFALGLAMIIGRLEFLMAFALLNPAFWRN